MEFLQGIGLSVRSVVLDFAGLLREEYSPGLFSLVLVVALVASLVLFALRIRSRVRAIRWLDRMVRQHRDEAEFSAGLAALTSQIEAAGRIGARHRVTNTFR